MSNKFVCEDLSFEAREENEPYLEERVYITLKNKKGVIIIKNIYWQVCNAISPEPLTKAAVQKLKEVVVGKSFELSLDEILGLEKYIN